MLRLRDLHCLKQKASMKKGNQLKAPANKPTQQFSTSWSHQTRLRSSLGLQVQECCEELELCSAVC